MAFSPTRSEPKSGTWLPGRRGEGPRIPVRRDRLEERQGLGFRKGQEEFPDVLAEILAVDELAPVLAVVEDRPPDRIELDAIVLDPREDRVAVSGDLDVPRIDSLQRTRLLLGLDPEHAEDLDAILRREPVEVVVEEAVHGLRLGGDLLDPRHP